MSMQNSNISALEQHLINSCQMTDFPEELIKSLMKIVKKEKYRWCNITKKTLSSKGDNFFGILHEVDIKGTANEGFKKETHLFIKQALTIKKVKIVSVDDIYLKEVFFYTELVKILEHLQREANIPETERFQIPKGYDESTKGAIILENLKKRDYKIFQKGAGLKLRYAELSIEQLAKFHALGLVMQKKMPDYYKMKIEIQKYPFTFKEDDDWRCFITNIWSNVIDAVEADLKDNVKQLLPKMLKKYQQYLTDYSPVCVLCHGDYKPQNIMMKEINGEIVSVIPLDYQLIHHGCPVTDFMFFVFSSSEQKFRRDNLEHLKNLYHDTLGQFLKYFEMDVDTIFPRQLFDQMYQERLLYGLKTGLIMAFFYFVPEDDVPDLQNKTLTEMNINPDNGFVNRVRGLVDDFIEWGCL